MLAVWKPLTYIKTPSDSRELALPDPPARERDDQPFTSHRLAKDRHPCVMGFRRQELGTAKQITRHSDRAPPCGFFFIRNSSSVHLTVTPARLPWRVSNSFAEFLRRNFRDRPAGMGDFVIYMIKVKCYSTVRRKA